MLHEDSELKISTAELLPLACNLLKDVFGSEVNLSDPVILIDKYTRHKVCIEYHQFILGAKSEKLEVASVHARLMMKRKDFIIYFADVKKFVWFEWHKIKKSGYLNLRISVKENIKVQMWNFKVSLGVELRAWLDDEAQGELDWWQK